MRRFLILICLLLLALPVGINLAGCGSNRNAQFCNGVGYGKLRGAVDSIDLEPKTTGISLAYGQTGQLGVPTAYSCPPQQPVSVNHFLYGSDNLAVVDVSDTGALCAGTWNRTSAGGTPDFTICTPPAAASDPNFKGGVAKLTAQASSVTSNVVFVYAHPPVSSITIPTQADCVSQGSTLPAPLSSNTIVKDAQGNQVAPQFVGNLTYAAVDPTIVTIDQTGVATAHNPGATAITATLSKTTSAAGYFYTCPPKSIDLKFADGSTSKTVQQNTPQPLTATVTDTKGQTITGLTLNYTSTIPAQISVSSTGQVAPFFPGNAAISAICQPPSCNPAPVNQIGQFGTGTPVVSNSVQVTTPGKSSNYLWIGSTGSQSFVPVDLITGTVGAAVKLPYFPNSMVMDQSGSNLYFGSYRELMIYSALGNALSKEDINVPGVVLAVSPDDTTVVINDQVRKLFYLYDRGSGRFISFGGVGTAAAYSPDGKTLYITGPDHLYVYSSFTGWSTYDIPGNGAGGAACMAANNPNSLYAPPGSPNPPYNPFCPSGVAVTVPSVGAFLAGSTTTAHAFCPDSTSNPYYPFAGSVAAATDKLAASNDGQHILGAQANPAMLFDIGVTIPIGACPANNTALNIPTTLNQAAIPGIAPTSIDQVVADPDSTVAFITYSTASTAGGAPLPYYKLPATAGSLGTLSQIVLAGGATAPVAGVFSPDNTLFFVGTSGDNLVHYIDVKSFTDIQQIDPKLVDSNGKPVAPQFLGVKPRPTI